MDEIRFYIAIDMKSFYASCEAVSMGLDPLKVRLLVADSSRSDQTICLAVSPALKAIGVPSRPRLFEAKRAINDYEKRTGTHVDYITATPRMALYEKISAQIYSIILKYAAPSDVHVYSIDERPLVTFSPDPQTMGRALLEPLHHMQRIFHTNSSQTVIFS